MDKHIENKVKVIEIFELVSARAKISNQSQVCKRLESALSHLINEKLTVVVCGEFKKGKSSFINAILEEDSTLCPVDIDIATAIPTIVEWSEKEQITVVLDEGSEKTKVITRSEIASYITEQGNPGNRLGVTCLKISGDFNPLKEGLILVDTPGIGGLNVEHRAVTYAILPEADIVVFVFDVLKPLTEPELGFIRDWVSKYSQRMIFILNKIDARHDYETAVIDARHKLATTLNCDGDELTIIPLSSLLKLEYLSSGDKDDLVESNFAALHDAFWGSLNSDKANILLTGAISTLSQAITDLRVPLESEKDVYISSDQKVPNKNLTEIKTARSRLKALQENNADWIRELNEGLKQIDKTLKESTEDILLKLKGEVNNYLLDPDMVKQPESIIDQIVPQIITFCMDSREKCKADAVILENNLKDSTLLNLNTAEEIDAPDQSTPRPPIVESPRGPKSLWGKVGAVLRAGWDLVWGIVFFWTLPRVIGNLSDNLKKAFQGDKLSPTEINMKIQHYLSECQIAIRRDGDSFIEDLRKTMSNELKEQIKQDVERCNNILKSMENAAKTPPDKLSENLNRVEQELKELLQIQLQVDELKNNVTERKWGDFAQ